MRTIKRAAAFKTLWQAVSGQRRKGSPPITARLRALPAMVRDTLTGAYPGLQRPRLGLMALAAAYVVSPVDVLPESLLLLAGLADDAVVLAWLAGAVLGETDAYLSWAAQRPQRHGDTSRSVPGHLVT